MGRDRGGQQKADPKRVGPFWVLSPGLQQGDSRLLWEHAFPGSLLEQKRELSVPHKPSHPRFLLPRSIPAHSLLPPHAPCHSHSYFGTARGPVSSCALQTSAGNIQPAPPRPPERDDCSPSSPVPDITSPSPHRPQMWQLPAGTRPCLSLAPSPKGSGANNPSAPSWTSNLSHFLWG